MKYVPQKLSLRAQQSPFDFAQGDRVMVSGVEPCFVTESILSIVEGFLAMTHVYK